MGCLTALFALPVLQRRIPTMAILCLVMYALCERVLPSVAVLAALAAPLFFGVPVGCRLATSVFGLLTLLTQHGVFRLVAHQCGAGSILQEITTGDPLGVLTLVRADAGTPVRSDRCRFGNQGALFEGTPWLLWAGWLEATYLARGAVSTNCTVKGTPLRIVNSHLANGVRNPHRQDQCEELVDFARDGTHRGATIICCDTNAHHAQPEMKWVRKAGFVDTFGHFWSDGRGGLRAETPHNGHTWDNTNPLVLGGNLVEPDQRIDYIWVDGGDCLAPEASRIAGDRPGLADHYAVISTFSAARGVKNKLTRSRSRSVGAKRKHQAQYKHTSLPEHKDACACV